MNESSQQPPPLQPLNAQHSLHQQQLLQHLQLLEKQRPPQQHPHSQMAAGVPPAMMMMMHSQMYPAGYQIPPTPYPTAPPTPGHPAMSAAAAAAAAAAVGAPQQLQPPPATIVYPHAPPPTPMAPPGPGYLVGYASGSSTPANQNARSPARTRKAASGVQTASDWLAQNHPHLGTPGPGSAYGSRAASVMSMAMASTMTGFQDDAMSVISGADGSNLVELQPAASHQAENVDPAQIGAIMSQAESCANAIVAAPAGRAEAAEKLANLVKTIKFPKEALAAIILKTLQSLCYYELQTQQLDPNSRSKLLLRLYDILYNIADHSLEMRQLLVHIAHSNHVFEEVVKITCKAMYPNQSMPLNYRIFHLAICFLNKLVRDEGLEYSKFIKAALRNDQQFFSAIFYQMINTHKPTSFEFMVRLLSCGNRRLFKEKINALKIGMLLGGTHEQEGIFRRHLRKRDESPLHNIIKIVELLVRNDGESQPDQDVQRFFIEQNVFQYLEECLRLRKTEQSPTKFVPPCMLIYASLTSSPHLINDHKLHMIKMIIEHGLSQTDVKTQTAIIFTLFGLSTNNSEIQRFLATTQCFNYACYLVRVYSDAGNFSDITKVEMLDNALKFCVQQLRLDKDAAIWQEAGEQKALVSFFFSRELSTALLNLLVAGCSKLRLRSLRVIVAGLDLPGDRFASFLLNAFDTIKGENVSAAVFNAVNDTMITASPAPYLIEAAVDLLHLLVRDATQLRCLRGLAKTHTSHFPLNILFGAKFVESNETLCMKLLQLCKQLLVEATADSQQQVADPELQQQWSQYREKFYPLSMSGYYDIAHEAGEILVQLGIANDGDSDFSMSIANGFCG